LLSVFPNGSKVKEEADEGATDENVSVSENSDQADMENKLTRILTKIEGAGDVDVMVTFESSEEIQPAYNSNQTTETTEEKDAQGGERTVTTSSVICLLVSVTFSSILLFLLSTTCISVSSFSASVLAVSLFTASLESASSVLAFSVFFSYCACSYALNSCDVSSSDFLLSL